MSNDFVVIGNGFDLQSGLKSKYSDFFNQHFDENCTELEKIKDYFTLDITSPNSFRDFRYYKKAVVAECLKFLKTQKSLMNIAINSWDFIFIMLSIQEERNLESILWVDVEESIKNFVVIGEKDIPSKLMILFKRLVTISNKEELAVEESIEVKLLILIFYCFIEEKTTNVDKLLEQSKLLLLRSINENNFEIFNRFLLNELNRFENNFRKYLGQELLNNDEYRNNALKVLDNVSIPDKNPFILSFNYTVPWAKTRKNHGINVHGSIIDDESHFEIIFGIDALENEFDSNNYMFTKTSRRLKIFSEKNNRPIPPKSEISNIIFFGHSLGLADYSYFFSIFDYYQLYESQVRLVFKFSVYDENLRSEIEYNIHKKVTDLIKKYGSTFPNGYQGKNLLHKLILENRINISELIIT